MFAYPKQAEFNRLVPKTKIYAHARVSKRIKALFAKQVGEIVWKYKLSPETINLPARNGINEIQVFDVTLKTPELDPDVLHAIDKAIPFPLIFQLTYDGQIAFAASHKRPSEAEASRWVIEATFQTTPRPVGSERLPLPVALDLAGLYEHIVQCHIPLPQRPGEGLAEQAARFSQFEAKRRTRQQLETRLEQEKQFNRKVELNAALRRLSQELEALSHG